VPLDEDTRARIAVMIDDLSARALRVLAVAYVPFDRRPVEADAPIEVRPARLRAHRFTRAGSRRLASQR
jgi:hypothetical protein